MNSDQILIRSCQAGQTPVAVRTSSLAEKLGTEITHVDPSARSIALGFRPDEFFIQAMNVVQGGAIASMLDFALAFAILAELPDGHSVASTSLTVSFVKPVTPGPLIARGCVDHVGKRSAFARATLSRHDGEVVATASSALSVLVPRN